MQFLNVAVVSHLCSLTDPELFVFDMLHDHYAKMQPMVALIYHLTAFMLNSRVANVAMNSCFWPARAFTLHTLYIVKGNLTLRGAYQGKF